MRRSHLILLLLPILAVPFAACSGGGGGSEPALRASCTGRGQFCLVSCNLGCTQSTGCGVSEIAVNQPLVFTFSHNIDPATVSPSTVSLKTALGNEPRGDLVVQGNTIYFLPTVEVVNGRPVFGFAANETYTLEIPGGAGALASIRSESGDILPSSMRCRFSSSLGVIDLDGKPPVSTLKLPETMTNVKADTQILLEFSEVIDSSPFVGDGAGTAIIFTVALSDPTTNPPQCVRKEFALPGVVTLSIDRLANKSTVVFRPSLVLPGESCIKVQVTKQIRDLAGTPAIPAIYEFRIEKRDVEEQFVDEVFDSQAKLDAPLSGADWGNNRLTTGKLGSSGVLGQFLAADGKDLFRKDPQGRDVFEWNTDSARIPSSRTLTGQTIDVTSGVFEFQTFVVKATERILFTGSKIPRIKAAGLVQIDGAIEIAVPTPALTYFDTLRGQNGGAGGIGGAAGGQGGDSPKYTGANKQINGRNGVDVVLPAGHPREASRAGTGGRGSTAHPASGNDNDIQYIVDQSFKLYTAMIAAGGAGGSLWDTGNGTLLGARGFTKKTKVKRDFWDYLPNDVEFGPPSVAGIAFPVLPEVAGKPSPELFLIGGSGGGGAGTHPFFSLHPEAKWSPGAGGAGGGGVIHVQAGGDLIMGDKALIQLTGGNTLSPPTTSSTPPIPSPGGAGSGGSILMQCGGIPQVLGEINVLGGTAGTMTDDSLLAVQSLGGAGGAGYVRVEADPRPSHLNLPRLKPTSTEGNTGLLRTVDYSPVSLATSQYYATRSLFTPTWLYYEVFAKLDGVPFTYSDNQAKHPGSRPATGNEAVVLLFQSAQVDPRTSKPIGVPTDWAEGSVKPLNSQSNEGKSGNGIRYIVRMDRSKTTSGQIEINRVRIYYRG